MLFISVCLFYFWFYCVTSVYISLVSFLIFLHQFCCFTKLGKIVVKWHCDHLLLFSALGITTRDGVKLVGYQLSYCILSLKTVFPGRF